MKKLFHTPQGIVELDLRTFTTAKLKEMAVTDSDARRELFNRSWKAVPAPSLEEKVELLKKLISGEHFD